MDNLQKVSVAGRPPALAWAGQHNDDDQPLPAAVAMKKKRYFSRGGQITQEEASLRERRS